MTRTPLSPAALALAALLALASVQVGATRWHTPTSAVMVLCIDGHMAATAVDSDGQPIGSGPRGCRDCVIAAFALPEAPQDPGAQLPAASVSAWPAAKVLSARPGTGRLRVRGPPVLS